MTLNELLERYLDKSIYMNYISQKKIDVEISEDIVKFIEKLNASYDLIEEEEFLSFSTQLLALNGGKKDCLIHLLFKISTDKYLNNKEDIERAVTCIDGCLKQGLEVPQSAANNADKYIGLLNCYQLFAHHVSVNQAYYSWFYPGVIDSQRNQIAKEIPFAINALRLVGELPTTDNFYGYNLSKPFYPLGLNVIKNKKSPLKKGVKNSDDYYPYKMIHKIATGDTGDNTFVATNGKKMLFVRGVDYYSPNAVLASKIATLISPLHFSSERALDNHLAASRWIPGYSISVADEKIRTDRKRYIEEENKIFPGSGIIDEVTNFVNEQDLNTENFGLSSADVYQAYLTKIDFDRCYLPSECSKKHYDRNILTGPRSGIYKGAAHIQGDSNYVKEKLSARLKLSMLPSELFSCLADKAFAPEDELSRKKAVCECTNRSNIALELFFEHPQVDFFLSQSPLILEKCYREIKDYISTHFLEEDQTLLQNALSRQVAIIKEKLDRKLTPAEFPIVEDDPSSGLPTSTKQSTASEITTAESTFLSRNWLTLSAIALLTLSGVGVGLALTATGILAPLGAGLVGFFVAAAVGFGAGLVVGVAGLGTKIAYDERQYQASKGVDDAENEGHSKPSAEVDSMIQKVKVMSQQLANGMAKAADELAHLHKIANVNTQEPEPDLSNGFGIK